MITDRFSKMFKRYSFQYWVVITLELLERGAYYGIMGYFPVHMMRNLGFTGTEFGILYALLLALLYTVPIISSSLAKRFGYKKILLMAFIILAPTYFALTFLEGYIIFFPLIIAWGIGAGAFKPMVSATIAHVTDKESRNSAYSIYYLTINWGSLIAMVMIGFLIPEAFAQIAFVVGAVLITANLIVTFIFYKNPVKIDTEERLSAAFGRMFNVLKDRKFTILLLIYAGFFFVFSSMHTFLAVYYTEFGIKPWGWFEAPLMTAFNPLTIVLLGPFLSRFMDRFHSLKLMITGMFIFIFGILLLGMVPIWYIFMIGIVIFSVGEFLTHPNFISYVSKIAPHDKVALYMGYAFIPSAIGNVTGSLAGGVLWDAIAVGKEQPSFFWAIYVAIGLITIANFLIYNRWISIKKGTAETKPSFFNSRYTYIGIYSLVVFVIILGMNVGRTAYVGVQEGGEEDIITYSEITISERMTDTLSEGDSMTFSFEVIDPNVIFFNISLTWQDEDDIQRLRTYENEPDTFKLSIEMTNITSVSNSGSNTHGSEGTIELDLSFNGEPENYNWTGTYNVIVELVSAGDFSPGVGVGLIGFGDTSNSFELVVDYTYLSEEKNE